MRPAGLRGKLPDSIKLPPSVTVPFGAFEEALGSKDNANVRERLEAAIKDIPQAHAVEQLQKCHDIAMEVGCLWLLQHVLAQGSHLQVRTGWTTPAAQWLSHT